jgi:ZIP family zinc transporter
MNIDNFLFAFGLTVFAGLATSIGSLIGLYTSKTNTKFLSVALGFSAGVMIYVSFVEIFQKARTSLIADLGVVAGNWYTVIAFFGGMLIIALIDKCVNKLNNPHEIHKVEELADLKDATNNKLYKTGILTALAIAIHNFPEGLATFASAMQDPSLGIAIAFAIAVHNIPEGIAVSVPIYYATGSKLKAFFYSSISGVAEPIGALVGYLLFAKYFTDTVFGILFAGVAGVMVFISLDQLLPVAREYGEHHLAIYGLFAGMVVMALSLLLFL